MQKRTDRNTKVIVARDSLPDPRQMLRTFFSSIPIEAWHYDVIFRDAAFQHVIGVAGLSCNVPAVKMLFSVDAIAQFLFGFEADCSILIQFSRNETTLYVHQHDTIKAVDIPLQLKREIEALFSDVQFWAGHLNSAGEHSVDLRWPSPGPHFNINLLLGNRIHYPDSLQTTPKSVVDRFGRGSFRSHAATQVLATRWDMRAEENGFPANRQFYLLENGSVCFYSGDGNGSNIIAAESTHSQNYTHILYRTACGLIIKRIIFILPQKDRHPIAVESHRIKIINTRKIPRKLNLVYTGMFGTPATHALWEDVLYSNLIMQAKLIKDEHNHLIAVGNDYHPAEFQKDLRFHTTFVHSPYGPVFPTRFCFDYSEFVGNGTLQKPQHAAQLSNRLNRKGPGFFAVSVDIDLAGSQTLKIDNFTGLIASPPQNYPGPDQYRNEIETLIDDHLDPDQTDRDLDQVKYFQRKYCDYIQIRSNDSDFDAYFNHNLPFQVLYQTYVSRSFGQTQKGYREIGFREIQDIYASMYYLAGMGNRSTIENLLSQWIENVFEMGYANHNFFWTGKEPGKWSDDALWLIPAVYHYVNITSDEDILARRFQIAGAKPGVKRTLLDTISAIIEYSAKISIGCHNLPLLDSADWNDCLKIDTHYFNGPEKEALYRQQLSEKGAVKDLFNNTFSESVMNAFLLKHGLDLAIELCQKSGDHNRKKQFTELARQLYTNIQAHTWKNDFFARVLLNRDNEQKNAYLGASGDGFSADVLLSGVYFLNSFSWSILSDTASDHQIAKMFDIVETCLKTPYGLKLMSPAALERLAPETATGHYFPGDRENGAVFKHAAMMATAALIKAAKQVVDRVLAQRMATLAYWMIDLALPYKSLNDPYQLEGNPRFCTQYINSATGINIGPLLSGTSTWLLLSLFSAYGIEFSFSDILLNPILKESQRQLQIELNTGQATYKINILKPKGFFRVSDSSYFIELDDDRLTANRIPGLKDKKQHTVRLTFVDS